MIKKIKESNFNKKSKKSGKKLILTLAALLFAAAVLVISVMPARALTTETDSSLEENLLVESKEGLGEELEEGLEEEILEEKLKGKLEESLEKELEEKSKEAGEVLARQEKIIETTEEKIDYYLAYPGTLPGHFLYPLKMIRDKIWIFFTTDSLRRAELFLLLADKRLASSQLLVTAGKEQLAVTTLTKGEKYLEQALVEKQKAEQKGKETRGFAEKLLTAARKHEEVLKDLQTQVSEDEAIVIEQSLKYSQQGQQLLSRPSF